MFGRATITLGIGPHSSFLCFLATITSNGSPYATGPLSCLSDPMEMGTSALPHVLAHVYFGQTAGWIRIPLGMEVGLSPVDIVLDGDWGPRSPTERGTAAPPHFLAHFALARSLISATAELLLHVAVVGLRLVL